MTLKHTKGPWSMFSNGFAVGVSTRDSDVAWTYFPEHLLRDTSRSIEEDEANARLIAAAPDLLEAAKLVIAWYEAEDDHSETSFYERMQMCRESEIALRAAIVKATGEAV